MTREGDLPSEVEFAVVDAAMAEELTEALGLLDDPELMERYRDLLRAKRVACEPPGER